MAIELVVEVAELKEGLRALFASLARGKQVESQYFDISASTEEITLEAEGFSYILPGDVRSPGSARLPYQTVHRLRPMAKLLTGKDVTISIVPGHLKLGPTDLANKEITLRPAGPRIADLPIDAPLRDILLLSKGFTPEEIEQSGLTRRYQEARRQADSLIENAAVTLEPLGVSREALAGFVWAQFKQA